MEHLLEYKEYLNEIQKYNIPLTEEEFIELLKDNIVTVQTGLPGQSSIKIAYDVSGDSKDKNVTVVIDKEELDIISSGKIVNKGNINIALADMGSSRINSIRKKYKK